MNMTYSQKQGRLGFQAVFVETNNLGSPFFLFIFTP